MKNNKKNIFILLLTSFALIAFAFQAYAMDESIKSVIKVNNKTNKFLKVDISSKGNVLDFPFGPGETTSTETLINPHHFYVTIYPSAKFEQRGRYEMLRSAIPSNDQGTKEIPSIEQAKSQGGLPDVIRKINDLQGFALSYKFNYNKDENIQYMEFELTQKNPNAQTTEL